MVKTKTIYACQLCGAASPKWSGQCASCNGWNSLVEEIQTASPTSSRYQGYAAAKSNITPIVEVALHHEGRVSTGITELDRVLGGGLVMGSVVLLGGDPGIGKSTLLLQTIAGLSQTHRVLYITGEESLNQVALRAHRLGLQQPNIHLLAETHLETILALASQEKPELLIVDSIQTVHTEFLQSAPGSVGQVRECAAQLVKYAKQTHTALFLVGHVTKEGALAGPRVLEHMVDTVLYFEGEQENAYRVIRAVKNRFGAVNELGIFAMTDKGLREVSNPSAIFLSRQQQATSGSLIMATREGTRPLLVEIQALVDQSYLDNPRRVSIGLESPRLAMLLAVLHRHGGISTHDQDVFINAVGGVRISETAADLPILLAIFSSLRNRVLPSDLLVFGEVGLAGEIRPVSGGQERLKEAAKQGFKSAIIPAANAPKVPIENFQLFAVSSLSKAMDHLLTLRD